MKLLLGNSLDQLKTIPDKSVHCCVTSPPYWDLRDYGIDPVLWPEVTFIPMAGLPAITIPEMTCVHGLEADVLSYVAHEVAIFREVKRVLRDDGTLWINLGDLIKLKDLVGIPWRVAFALQADGWYLRCDIIWNKPNPMPESVYDRPTKSHEYIFQFSKSQKYFFDQEAVKEDVTGNAHARGNGVNPKSRIPTGWDASSGGHNHLRGHYNNNVARLHIPKQNESFAAACCGLVGKRNIRSVWTIPTQGFKEAHFATFPERLPELCIKAGTSEKGCCPECGAPWVRITEKTKCVARKVSSPHAAVPGQRAHSLFISERHEDPPQVVTIGWQPSCSHNYNHNPIPCTVLDLFTGSGRTGVVASKLNRNFIGVEIKPEYLKMTEQCIYEVAPLFAENG